MPEFTTTTKCTNHNAPARFLLINGDDETLYCKECFIHECGETVCEADNVRFKFVGTRKGSHGDINKYEIYSI